MVKTQYTIHANNVKETLHSSTPILIIIYLFLVQSCCPVFQELFRSNYCISFVFKSFPQIVRFSKILEDKSFKHETTNLLRTLHLILQERKPITTNRNKLHCTYALDSGLFRLTCAWPLRNSNSKTE